MSEIEKDILENYGEMGPNYFVEKYGIPRTRVGYLASKLKVTITKKSSREKAFNLQKEIYEMYKSMSISDISYKLKISWGHIKETLINQGIEIKKAKEYIESYELDESFFEVIDTPEKAYWLGFLAADGNCFNNRLCLGLASKDHGHLEKFKNRIKYSGPIKKRVTSCDITFVNKKMINDLIGHGVVRRKTFALDSRILKRVEQSLKKHFILGYIDGDGCARVHSNGAFSISICGMVDLMWEIRLVVFEETGLLFSEPKAKNPEKPFSNMILNANQAKTKVLFSYFYKNGSEDFLDRKKQAFIDKLEKFKEDDFPEHTLRYIKSREISKLTRLINQSQKKLDELLLENTGLPTPTL